MFVRPAPYVLLAGWGSGSQVSAQVKFQLPHAAQLRYSGTWFTSNPEKMLRHLPVLEQPLRSTKPAHDKKLRFAGPKLLIGRAGLPIRSHASALGKHAGKNALNLVAIPRGVVPVDGALQSFPKQDLWLPSKEFLGQ